MAVKLARKCYFGNVVMRVKTLSALDKEKIKAIKEKIWQVYNFSSRLEFELIWKKCLTAILKACQAL